MSLKPEVIFAQALISTTIRRHKTAIFVIVRLRRVEV